MLSAVVDFAVDADDDGNAVAAANVDGVAHADGVANAHVADANGVVCLEEEEEEEVSRFLICFIII